MYTRPHSPGRELDIVDGGFHRYHQQQSYESYAPEYPVYLNSSGSNLEDSKDADLDGSDTSGQGSDKNNSFMKVKKLHVFVSKLARFRSPKVAKASKPPCHKSSKRGTEKFKFRMVKAQSTGTLPFIGEHSLTANKLKPDF